jgi:Ca-activated chloride channel family protein
MKARPLLLVVALAGLPLPAELSPAAGAQQALPATRSERLKALPPEERKWLEEFAAPIILPDEEKLFLRLTDPHQRETFKEEFWKRREKTGLPPPLGPGYRDRYAELRRLADEKYDGWRQDAGRMVVRHGEPDDIETSEECDVLRGLEFWTYARLATAGRRDGRFLFYRPTVGVPRRLWHTGLSDSELYSPSGEQKDSQYLAEECGYLPMSLARAKQPPMPHRECYCRLFKFIQDARAMGSAAGGSAEAGSLLAPPQVSTEGLDKLADSFPSLPDSKARPISVEGPSAGAVPVSNSANAGSGSSTPAGGAQQPVPATRAERLKALPPEEREWLEEFVSPIILPEEEKLFLELTAPHQREAFKEEFWQRREKSNLAPPLGPGYRHRYAELRRLADEKYDGWRKDAGRLVLRWGEPASVDKLEGCGETFRDLEIWTYNSLGASGRNMEKHFFYRPAGQGARRLWTVGTRNEEVFQPNSCRKSFDELGRDCSPALGDPCFVCRQNCEVFQAYAQIRSRQGSQAGAAVETARLFAPPPISTEGLDAIKNRFPTQSDPTAKPISVEGPSGTAVAPASPSAKVTSGASTPAPTRRKLSKKEVKELTAALEAKYRQWLEFVDLIISDDEREVFLQIADEYQKDRFIENFWRRRSIDEQGLRSDFQAVYTRRVETATEQFKSLNNDRAKIFVLNGPPDAMIPIDCPEVYVPIQIWYYDRLEALKSKVYLIFYQRDGVGMYKLWLPLDGENVLQVGGGIAGSIASRRPVDQTRCAEWRTLRQAISYSSAVLGPGASSMASTAKLFQPPVVETEGVDQILTMTTDLASGSTALGVTKLVRFPEARASKIGVDLSLLVAKADLTARALGEEQFYNVDVIGEVVKEDRLIDNFKYRFDIPTSEVGGEKIPLTVRRYLYPGEYKLVLKISDGNQNAEGRISDSLQVPEQPDAPPPEIAAARAQGREVVERAQEGGFLPSAISLLPVAKEIVTGLQRFETKTAEGIRAVDFYLNGAKVMTKTRPPFQADLNLGPLPRKHTIRVVAYGDTGRAVGEDEYIVNEGKEVFRVRILSPEKGARVSGPIKVVAAVAVPEGKTLQKLEFFSNEKRVATLYQPPYEQTVNVRDSKSLGYVRVLGTMEDGTVAEDLRYVNAPPYISEVTVDAVELYTTVTERSGRPVQGLQASNFKVYEDGAVQKIESFDYVKNLPLALGVIVDTSASMLESLPEVQKAALAFLDYSVGPKDRAFTVSFDNEPYLLTRLTNRKDRLLRSLAGLRAEGSTALYDAVVYGLYQFTGIKGKKALVVLTDGKDTASKFDFETTLDYVRKAGLSIYGIGYRIAGTDLEVKYRLNKMAQATGGQTFYVDSSKNLEAVYRQINEDLRSQYLLTYYSTNTGGKEKWRKVEIKVEPSNLQARTLSGYYP